MASWQMGVVAAFVRLVYRRRFLSEAAGLRTLRRSKGASAPPKSLTRAYAVSTTREHGFDLHRVRPSGAGTGVTVLYLHGGAYTSEIVRQHWSLIGWLAGRTGHEVVVPIYGLAPAHQGLQALDFVTAVIAAETARGRRVYLAGDSAGGGLALLAAQAVGGPAGGVAGVTAIAPWLDLSISNPEVDLIEPHDPWLKRPGLRPIAAAWAGDVPLRDPRLSPLFGDLSALPPLQILVGTCDITLADCRLLRDRLPAGVPLTYHEEPGAIHDYPLLPVPEARAGRSAIADHIRRTTQPAV
ncbi:alpha/beta hydrolase [Actinoplanes utahensis]|uniref:Alpha/beta hydrolase fold-3 domain-containing protein n=1 Tax=Actinoplanes utahensis TaxID=1869 RepID=A0A0A6UNC2_ACTUT|nr:alpha/beta hydrolase [Actinoplanes utahensis]KHD75784.1 hypothetical protein MB27_21320 [Actinoplanes utahensis]